MRRSDVKTAIAALLAAFSLSAPAPAVAQTTLKIYQAGALPS